MKEAQTDGDLAYFAQLDHSQQVFKAVKEDAAIREKFFEKCQFTSEEEAESKAKLVSQLSETDLRRNSKWQFRKPEDVVDIQGRLSEDFSLFYTVDDVRTLFNWKRPIYQNICKLLSSQYLGFSKFTTPDKLELRISMQAVLTEL